MWTVHQKAQFVLRYAELKWAVAVHRKWRSLHPGEKPPTEKALNRWMNQFNPLNAELNPICHLLALLGAHHILHFSRIRVKETGTVEKQKSTGRQIRLVLFKL